MLRHGARGVAESALPQPARVLSVPRSRWSPGRVRLPQRPPSVTSYPHLPAGSEPGALLQPAALGAGAGLRAKLYPLPRQTPTPTAAPPSRPGGRGHPGSPPLVALRPPAGWGPYLAAGAGARAASCLDARGRGRRGEGAPSSSLSPPDGRRGLRGAPGGPGSPRAVWPGRGALPCAPRAAGLGRSHRPRRDGAGRDGAGKAGAGRRRPVPAPPSSAGSARVRQSVGPCAPAARRGRVGTARMLFPTTPTPSRTRWLLPRFLASRLNPLLATRRRERLSSPLHPGPLPSLGNPEDGVRSPSRSHVSREILSRGGGAGRCSSVRDPRGLGQFPLPTFPGSWVTSPSCGVPGANVQASAVFLA